MNETPQQYIQRITANLEGRQPLAVLAATPKKIERLIQTGPVSKMRRRPLPDKWSVNEIAAHFADVEVAVGFRLRLILGAPGTAIAAYDQDAWVVALHYEEREPRKSLAHFSAAREANLALLKSLKPEQWKHYGVHAERGKETIEQVVRLLAGHDLNHLKQIERILSG